MIWTVFCVVPVGEVVVADRTTFTWELWRQTQPLPRAGREIKPVRYGRVTDKGDKGEIPFPQHSCTFDNASTRKHERSGH